MDKETTQIISKLPVLVEDDYLNVKMMQYNSKAYIHGNQLRLMLNTGGMLIIDLRDVDGDIAPFHS